MKRAKTIIAVAALSAASPAVAAAEFSASVFPSVGPCGNAISGVSSGPVERSIDCDLRPLRDIPGSLKGSANASFGHVGGFSKATHDGNYFGSAIAIGTTSRFRDFVTFTSSDPLAAFVSVAANLDFSGTLTASSRADANARGTFYLSTQGFIVYADTVNGASLTGFNVVAGGLSSGSSRALLRTGSVIVPLNTPIAIELELNTAGGAAGDTNGQIGSAEFSNSFEIPFGIDAFVLPTGVTANAGSWLVNNRRVGAAVPEPANWALMVLGFGLAGWALRRRGERRRTTRYSAA